MIQARQPPPFIMRVIQPRPSITPNVHSTIPVPQVNNQIFTNPPKPVPVGQPLTTFQPAPTQPIAPRIVKTDTNKIPDAKRFR